MSIQQDQGENNSDIFSSGQYEVNRSLENKNFPATFPSIEVAITRWTFGNSDMFIY